MRNSTRPRRFLRVAAVSAVLLIGAAVVPLVHPAGPVGLRPAAASTAVPAQDEPDDAAVAATSWGFTTLGLPETVRLDGIAASRSFLLPSSAELTPRRVTGEVHASLDAAGAVLEVLVDGRRATTVTLDGRDVVPFAVELPEGDGPIEFGLRTLVPFDDAYCRGRFTIPTVTVSDLAVGFDVDPALPTDIAGFLPDLAEAYRLWIPTEPDGPEIDATLRLAAGLVQRAGAAPIRLVLQAFEPDAGRPWHGRDYLPTVRDLVIGAPQASSGLALDTAADGRNVALLLPADAPDLAAAALFDELTAAATTDRLDVLGPSAAPLVPAREQPLARFGLSTRAATGTGRIELGATVPQAAFGQMVERMRLRISGRVTPDPDDSLTVSVVVDGVILDATEAAANGTFAIDVTVEEPTLVRDNTVELLVEQRDGDGPCSADARPIEVQVSADASVEVELGASLPIGFPRLPQAALPEVAVALGHRSVPELAGAVDLLARLQRSSPNTIGTRSIDLADVVGHAGPVLVSWVSTEPLPDLGPGSAGLVASGHGDGAASTVDLDGRTLVLTEAPTQVAVGFDGDHVRIVHTAADRAAASQLFTAIDRRAGGLASLTGDHVVLVDGRLRELRVTPDPVAATPEADGLGPGALVIGLGVVALVVGAAVGIRRRIRR